MPGSPRAQPGPHVLVVAHVRDQPAAPGLPARHGERHEAQQLGQRDQHVPGPVAAVARLQGQ
eukprot:5199050-Lingulodinium_polyedra.AAC.1